uniref:Predicted protein n=1 Tax=Hordeum vulgare subsp. vulgare TaxID=112509 RepID=F2DB38_HORVV|nr:predicted protein [Hordeum vulgare subsp. vulgare]
MGVHAAPSPFPPFPFPRREEDHHHHHDVLAGDRWGAHRWGAMPMSPTPPPMSSCGRYILHRVCRFDTLAGVAIKYGVEVADVKRVNGLTADLQMFAHKTLRIPLPGRHPPAQHSPPSSAAAREWTTRRPPKNAWCKKGPRPRSEWLVYMVRCGQRALSQPRGVVSSSSSINCRDDAQRQS